MSQRLGQHQQLPRQLHFPDEVRQALASGLPVLALESTVISHGLPWPENLATGRAIEQRVREAGAVPATIAVLQGQLCVGLNPDQLEELARLGQKAEKCSRRDLPLLMQAGATAGTTVAATMMIAAMAGIRVFATGGLGGVHRGAAESFDISADLQELARTPVAVVCAGPKAVLDIGLTLEYLETHGVPVIGYRCDQLPAFYFPDSGYTVDKRQDSVAAIAEILRIQWSLGMFGAVIANPIPAEDSLDRASTEEAIAQATEDAIAAGISGKALTPWLLARMEKLTAGKSLQSNKSLLLNNAQLGAEIAKALVD